MRSRPSYEAKKARKRIRDAATTLKKVEPRYLKDAVTKRVFRALIHLSEAVQEMDREEGR